MSKFCFGNATPHSSGESQLTSDDVEIILNTMFYDQEEHQFFAFCPTYAKYRSIVCQWMLDLGDYFNLHETTSNAAIAYLDRLQPNEKFSRNQWQMLGICCLIMAAKYNENEEHVPELVSLQSITQQEIPREELLKYELWALQRMGWILCARTVPAFLSCYRFLGSVFEADVVALAIAQGSSPVDTGDLQSEVQRLSTLAQKQCSALATMTALDSRFKPFPCSLVAAAVLYVSRRCLGLPLDDVWPTDLVVMTRYTVEDISSLVHMIDRASEEITRWAQSSSKGVAPTTPAKTVSGSITSIHPSKGAAESNIRSGKATLKYSFDSEEAQAALKNAAMEDAGLNDNFSPVSIAEQFQVEPKMGDKFEPAGMMNTHVHSSV